MESRLLIFDLDGTLANTLDTIKTAVNMCMEHFGYPTQSYSQVRANVGNGVRVLMQKSLPEEVVESKELFEAALEYFNCCYKEVHDRIDGCYDGVYDAVITLYNMGYKLAVLSNKPHELVISIVKKLFGDEIFSVVMGQTELPKKPDPTVPKMIAKKLDASMDNCWFIGDSEVDVATARNSGMNAVAVSWGFRDRVLLEGADFIADTPGELTSFFSK